MADFEINDRVKQKNTRASRFGTVIGVWEKDIYIDTEKGEKILFAEKGEYKVRMDNQNNYSTFSSDEIIKV